MLSLSAKFEVLRSIRRKFFKH